MGVACQINNCFIFKEFDSVVVGVEKRVMNLKTFLLLWYTLSVQKQFFLVFVISCTTYNVSLGNSQRSYSIIIVYLFIKKTIFTFLFKQVVNLALNLL